MTEHRAEQKTHAGESPLSTEDAAEVGPHDARTTFTPPRRPRWVTVSGIVVGLLVLLFVILNIVGVGPGAGGHGPGMHRGAGVTSDAGQAPSP